MSLVAGVDSSTQSVKVELRAVADGALAAEGRAPHPPTGPPPRSEQHPGAWWSALCKALAQCGPRLSEVEAVSVAAQQHGLVALDDAGAALRPAKLWNDTESAPQAAALVARLGPAEWARSCGSVPVASFTITKLAWLLEREPGLSGRVAQLMLPHDYLTFRLTGKRVTDRGDASGTGWYDPGAGRYRADLLALAGGSSDWLPRVLGPSEAAGVVSASAAAATGLPAGIPVASGTGDNMAAALGLGLRPGDLALSLGTSGTVYTVSDGPTADATGHVAGFCDASGRYLPLVCTLNATRVTDSVAGWLGLDRDGMAEAALSAPFGAGGVVLVGHFDGERTPNLPDATGSFLGLRTGTSRADLARAAHEGVMCGLLAGVDALARAGVRVSGRLHLIGGGARSAAYRQIAADLWGEPIRVPSATETVAAGACVQAAVQSGLELKDAAEAWGLGAGVDVDPAPRANGAAVRTAYNNAVAHALALQGVGESGAWAGQDGPSGQGRW